MFSHKINFTLVLYFSGDSNGDAVNLVQIDYQPVIKFLLAEFFWDHRPVTPLEFSRLKCCVSSWRGSHFAQEAGQMRGTVGLFRSGKGRSKRKHCSQVRGTESFVSANISLGSP